MPINTNIVPKVQVRLTSAVESVRASLEHHRKWIEEMVGVPLGETLTLECDSNPCDAVAEELLQGLPVVSATKARNSAWRALIESWTIAPGVSARIAVSLQRERQPKSAPLTVWELAWKDLPVALRLRGLTHRVVSLKVPTIFPPGEMPIFSHAMSPHWFITHREDAAKVLLLRQEVESKTERYVETTYGRTRLQARYDWDSVVLDANTSRMVRTDFELFFQREEWFRQHNLPYRRGYLLWGPPGNGKSATIRIMCAHTHIMPFGLDLSDEEGKSGSVLHLFERAAENAPSLVVLEDLDRCFPLEGKRTKERTISFQTLLNCLDGIASRDGLITIATANDPTCLDPAILKRPGRFDRVVQFKNPDANLRREYYQRLNPVLTGERFEIAIEATAGLSFAELRESFILGAQSAFEQGREVQVEDVIEAIELRAAGAHDLKTSVGAPGFVQRPELSGD